jgi:hypothetical protein
MQSTDSESPEANSPQSSSGKMFLAYCPPKTTPSVASSLGLPVKMCHFSRQGSDGRTRVLCLDPKEQSRGESSTPNISEWPNDAAVCLLSQVLETGSIPARYYLSSTACEGILRRAEKRGKKLPEMLEAALRAQVRTGTT